MSGQRTFYLDHATLAYAFGVTYGSDKNRAALKELEGLTQVVEDIAKNRNLCVSLIHMQELAQFIGEQAQDMERWLDSLPLVWTRSVQHFLPDEVVAALECILGGVPRRAIPWASCFTATLETPTPAVMSGKFLHLATIPITASGLRTRNEDRAGDEAMKWARIIYENNKWADADGWNAQRKREWAVTQSREGVRAAALSAAQRFGIPYRKPHVREAIDELVRVYIKDRYGTLPGRAVQEDCIADWLAKARANLLGPKHRSSVFDIQHATMGAAFGDVFTCDSRTAPGVARARASLGKRPALVSRPKKAFRKELENAASQV